MTSHHEAYLPPHHSYLEGEGYPDTVGAPGKPALKSLARKAKGVYKMAGEVVSEAEAMLSIVQV